MRKENCRTFLTMLRFCEEVDGPSSVFKSPAIFCKMTMTIYLFSYAKKGEFILCNECMGLPTFSVSVTAEVVSSSSAYSENKEGCLV